MFTRFVKRLLSTFVQPKPKPSDTIIIAMSSGVDSTVAASMYKDYPNVKGIYMANWQRNAKCNEEEWKLVNIVCKQLGIPCERVNFEKEYWQQVFNPMIESYSAGFTPNPDLNCNKYIKFGELIHHLDKKYKNYWLVTGHYVRMMNYTGIIPEDVSATSLDLLRAKYMAKDQSYYLASINKTILNKLLFPIGHLTKPEVRQIAQDLDLANKDKPDSMGLCFVSQDEKKFDKFLDDYIQPKPGNIVTEDGKVWGQHNGLWYGTIGQKAKISMPQGDPKYKGTWFISEKRYETNELVIVKGTDNPQLFKNTLEVNKVQWLQPPVAYLTGQLTMQYRSLQKPIEIDSISGYEENNGSSIKIKLLIKQRAMAPGQNIVIYDGERVLGSGVLTKASNT